MYWLLLTLESDLQSEEFSRMGFPTMVEAEMARCDCNDVSCRSKPDTLSVMSRSFFAQTMKML